MYQSKFIKFIWAVNGVTIFIIAIFGLIYLIMEISPALFHKEYEYNKGVIVEDKKSQSKKINIDLQHLLYDTPIQIQNSNYYYSTIHVVDKDLPKEVFDVIKGANDFNIDLLGGTINVIFFNQDESQVYPLLEDFGYISFMDVPRYYRNTNLSEQPERDYILYKIALKDTDGNGRINESDSSSYYITDLTGKNLQRITPSSLNLKLLDFLNDEKNEILFEQVIKKEQKDELGLFLKTRYIYSYNLKSHKFKKLEQLQKVFDNMQKRFRNN